MQYSVYNHAGKKEMQALIELSGNESTSTLTAHVDETDGDPITAADLGTVTRMVVDLYDETGTTLTERRTYHETPASGGGSDGTNYDPTFYAYDDMGRQRRIKEASGTIRRTTYDAIGRMSAEYIGTNDSTFSGGEPSGTDNMVKTSEVEYDSGNDDGNSYVTKRTLYVEDSATDERETSYTNDVRGNVVLETRPESPHVFHKYDNMDRRLATGSFSSTASIDTDTDDPTTETTNRLGLSQTFYDAEGRVWKSQHHKIDGADGSDDNNLQTLYWYSEDGRRMKTDGKQLTKTSYDRLGRTTKVFVLASDDDTAYADVDDVTGDIVLEESQSFYGDDSDNAVMRTVIQRFHDDYGSGETTGALDTNADGDDLLITASNIEGRVQITGLWYDAFGRLEDSVEYGTYGGSDFDRDGLSVPARSDTALRTTYVYGTAGLNETVEDPMGVVTKYEYDDAGRTTKVIRNYDAGVNSGNPSGNDDNVTIEYEYDDGLKTRVTADLPSGQTDQDTTYTYGTTKGTSAGDSRIATGHLLQEIEYPDAASASDVVSFAYNAQGEEVWKEDQAGNVLETEYDDAGRVEHVRVTTLASGFDGAVRRISRTHTAGGSVERVTQYDDATVGSGSVVNEVKYGYTDWGTIGAVEQDRNSAVGAVGSVDDYEVRYGWSKATSGRNTLRKSSMILPSGNTITYEYLSANHLHDDEASRVSRVKDGTTVLATYAYNGVGSEVGTTYPEPDVMWNRYGSTSGDYPDLDRFDRVTSRRWTKDLATDVDFYDVDLAYDRNGNVTLTEDNVHAGFDVERTLDDLNRATRAEEGTWNGSSITSRTRDQQWALDHGGNWDVVKLDLDGDGSFTGTDEYDDDRTHNDVNELTGRDTDDNGTDDYTLTFDATGNVTDDGESWKYVYDAFGRLRKVLDRSDDDLVLERTYYGIGRQASMRYDTDNSGAVDGDDLWFHFVYDTYRAQVAVYRADDTSPKQESIAGASGLAGTTCPPPVPILTDTDDDNGWTEASDGLLESRAYLCSSERRDVVSLVNSSGSILEWASYSSFGTPIGLPGGDADSDGDCDSADLTQIQSWIDTSSYDVRGDLDLDGDVDASDKTRASSTFNGVTLGWGELSNVRNTRGQFGRQWEPVLGATYWAGDSEMNTTLGRSLTRVPKDGQPSVSASNKYQTKLPGEQRRPPVANVRGFGPIPGTSLSGSTTAPFALRCSTKCPQPNRAAGTVNGMTAGLWVMGFADGVDAIDDGHCDGPCRIRGRAKVHLFMDGGARTQGIVCNTSPMMPVFDDCSLCWGWHGKDTGDIDPHKMVWTFAGPSESQQFFDTANTFDQSEVPLGECVACAGTEEDIFYQADAPLLLPLMPVEKQVDAAFSNQHIPVGQEFFEGVSLHLQRGYKCSGGTFGSIECADASDKPCKNLEAFTGSALTGCPVTH